MLIPAFSSQCLFAEAMPRPNYALIAVSLTNHRKNCQQWVLNTVETCKTVCKNREGKNK